MYFCWFKHVSPAFANIMLGVVFLMGMYDNLKISTSKLPLSDNEKATIGENVEWQTKDFECILSTAEITDDGKLKFLDFRYEWDETLKSGMFELNGKMGGLVTKDEEWIELNDYHGYVNFYTSVNNIWYEFNAKFTDGQLVNIERVGYPLKQPAFNGSCFGRISESVFNELKSLDDLIIKMGTTEEGHKISDVGDPKDFKSRMKHFREFLNRELPEFTEEEILKFDKHSHKFKKIYDWHGVDYFLIAMEYEKRKNYRNSM